MTAEQQGIINVLTYLAALITVLGGLFAATYRARTNAHIELTKTQTETTKAQATEIPTLVAQMMKLASDTNEILKSVIATQSQGELNTKRLLDQREPLDSVIKQNAEVMGQVRDVLTASQQTMAGAMREMRGAQGAIIAAVNDRIDENTSGLSAALSGVNATASGNATRLTVLDQKVSDHNAMTAEQFKDLFAKLDGLPDQIAAVIKPVLAQMQAMHEREIQALQAQYDSLAEQLAAANRRIVDLTAAPVEAPKPAARVDDPPAADPKDGAA